MTDARQPYRAARLVELASWIRSSDEDERWRLVAEFLEEFRHEEPVTRLALLREEPPPIGDPNWDAFLAGLAEHLAAKDGRAGPPWSEGHVLPRFWFPFNTPAARVDAFVHAPAAFRRRGVFVAASELDVA
ncbi:hypothetical protein [Yinghuangia soli]|uniref:Uncharacterized protein n=1 Tax=Yinghuangia soli TaxID=2908204 RepID=A0AA41Q2X2_9ACTN|nr:hypothetical protein [Yinghuangia soli]MCF2529985.1 hypothetical protein [Yinghuangia soli]